MKSIGQLKRICGGDPEILAAWTAGGWTHWVVGIVAVCLGSGVYGFTIGIWRAPLQGLYAGLKFPLLVLLTTLGNALINGMLAQLMGLRIPFRQSSLAILTSFAIVSVILGSLAPIMLFVTYNTPPLEHASRSTAHAFILLIHVCVIAAAGTLANVRLMNLLNYLADSRGAARRVFIAWLSINFLLGSQLAWNLRPFIGSPGLPVRLVRPDAFEGSFYETVYRSAIRLASPPDAAHNPKGTDHDR